LRSVLALEIDQTAILAVDQHLGMTPGHAEVLDDDVALR
jgi:hypothetical protein